MPLDEKNTSFGTCVACGEYGDMYRHHCSDASLKKMQAKENMRIGHSKRMAHSYRTEARRLSEGFDMLEGKQVY